MRPRVVIVHGWSGHSEEGWFPWLKRELEARGALVLSPDMPSPDRPDIFSWVTFLRDIVSTPTPWTYFVGHSLGAQAILRYIEGLPPTAKVGGALFVAGFERLGGKFHRLPEAQRALHPWLEAPIHWELIRGKAEEFVGIFSDNDEWVTVENIGIFHRKLGAETVLLHDHHHFSGSDGFTELPIVLDHLLPMMGMDAAAPARRL
jgi:hypothetical protein